MKLLIFVFLLHLLLINETKAEDKPVEAPTTELTFPSLKDYFEWFYGTTYDFTVYGNAGFMQTPFSYPLRGEHVIKNRSRTSHKSQFAIVGQVLDEPKGDNKHLRFSIALLHDANTVDEAHAIPFYFNVRFEEKQIVYNYMRFGKWNSPEQVHSLDNIFEPGKNFTFELRSAAYASGFYITVNGQKLPSIVGPARFDLEFSTNLAIDGDINIWKIMDKRYDLRLPHLSYFTSDPDEENVFKSFDLNKTLIIVGTPIGPEFTINLIGFYGHIPFHMTVFMYAKQVYVTTIHYLKNYKKDDPDTTIPLVKFHDDDVEENFFIGFPFKYNERFEIRWEHGYFNRGGQGDKMEIGFMVYYNNKKWFFFAHRIPFRKIYNLYYVGAQIHGALDLDDVALCRTWQPLKDRLTCHTFAGRYMESTDRLPNRVPRAVLKKH